MTETVNDIEYRTGDPDIQLTTSEAQIILIVGDLFDEVLQMRTSGISRVELEELYGSPVVNEVDEFIANNPSS